MKKTILILAIVLLIMAPALAYEIRAGIQPGITKAYVLDKITQEQGGVGPLLTFLDAASGSLEPASSLFSIDADAACFFNDGANQLGALVYIGYGYSYAGSLNLNALYASLQGALSLEIAPKLKAELGLGLGATFMQANSNLTTECTVDGSAGLTWRILDQFGLTYHARARYGYCQIRGRIVDFSIDPTIRLTQSMGLSFFY
jgi:hypothetical protein